LENEELDDYELKENELEENESEENESEENELEEDESKEDESEKDELNESESSEKINFESEKNFDNIEFNGSYSETARHMYYLLQSLQKYNNYDPENLLMRSHNSYILD
ncbi:9848_t:CDS:2, partial [Racocetra fulgida]